ncbi:adenine phosphoribosyltransferase [Prochlorococcus sp. HOT_208_60]|nr:adenine phosphoribosyltransferase [Prochlorococcus sp. HOT_208_60]
MSSENILIEKLKHTLRDYPDFPKKGILFKDVLTILKNPELFSELIKEISNYEIVRNSEAIVAIDARGFIFGSALSLFLKKPLILARKPGKLPGELISNTYDLEYGSNTLCLQKDSLEGFNKFCIIDDLLATGGTAAAVEDLILNQSKTVTGLVVVVELQDLEGRRKFKSPVNSVIKF